jgi:predicted chitinase
VADNPNDQILPQILALLEGEKDLEQPSNAAQTEQHKGIIKDRTEKPKEKPASLTSNEEGRLKNIGVILANTIGRELQIGKYKPGPEAGRLKMEQTKVGSAVNVPKPPPAPTGPANSILDLLKNLGWMALLGGIAAAAAALYDNLGALGRGLTKIALKLAPYIGKLARFGGKIIRGIGMLASGLGKLVTSLSDAFKYFKTKGIAGFLDDLKMKFPKTSQFVDDTLKLFDDFKNWFKNSWFGKTLDNIKAAIKARFKGLFVMKVKTASGKELELLTGLGAKVEKIKDWWKNTVGRIFDLKFLQKAEKAGDAVKGAKDLGKFGQAVQRVIGVVKGIGGFVGKIVGWLKSGFGALTEIGGTVAKVLGKGKGGGILAKMLGGAFKLIGKMLQPILKKLPVIGAVMSIGFAWARFQKGETIPAILELISGILSFIPGIGTVGSIIIDGALMLYDMDKQKKEEAASGIEPKEGGGIFGKIKKWMGDWLMPKLRYLPFIGAMFYYADAISAFTSGDLFNGIDNLLKGLIATVGGKGLVDLINSAYPVIKSFFTDEEKAEPEAKSEEKGGFFSWVKDKFAEAMGNREKLSKIPFMNVFFYGADAWNAFKGGKWGEGFKFLGLALLSALPITGIVQTISLGINWVLSFFDDNKDQGQPEEMKSDGGFWDSIKGAWEAIGGIVVGAIDAIKNWISDTIKSITEKAKEVLNPMNWFDGEEEDELSDEEKQRRAKKMGWDNWDQYKKSNWKKNPETMPAAQAAAPATTSLPTNTSDNEELMRRAKAMGWNTADEYKNSGWKENPAIAKGAETAVSAVEQNAKAMGWKTVDEYRNSGWKQNPAIAKGAESAEDPVVLRNAKAMGWNTVEEYRNANWKQNPAMIAAVPAASTTTASFTDTTAAGTTPTTGIATAAPGYGVAPGQVAQGFATAAAPATTYTPTTPSAPLNQDVKANIAAVMEAVKAKGFTNPKYLAAVYGNVMKETGGKIMAENMNYSTTSNARIRSIFGSRVAGMTDAQINQIKSTPESFGNAMYGGHTRIGKNLGNVEPGDGFKFRGRGFVQLTGRAAYTKASKAIFGDDRLVQNPDLVLDRQVGALVTAWELEDRKSWAGKYGIDYNNMTQEQANMLVTSKIAGTKVTRGQGYLGGLLTKVDQYSTQFNPADYAGGSTAVAAAMPSNLDTMVPANTNTATGAATAGIMSALGMQAPSQSTAQFQAQSISVPSAGGPVTTTWTGGESNFNINGANMGPLNSEFRRRLESMAAEYRQKTGKKITVSGPRSAYRTYEQQVQIYKTARPGYAATPGSSNHGFGFALDINTADANRAESLGLLKKYGLHRPMMSPRLYEPWHLEPVGLDKSKLAQYRARKESGKFSGDQLAFALTGGAAPPYTEGSFMPAGSVASAATPTTGSAGTVFNTGASSTPDSSGGGLFSGLTNLFTPSSLGTSAESAGGGISNLSSSSTPGPMSTMGAESNITSKMDDIASKQISKADEEINVLKDIEKSIKELNKQISALSRVTINNVSGGDGKTSITNANIPETDKRLEPQTSGGFFGGKLFGFA